MDQLGFEIEEIDVAGGAGHEQLDHAFRLGSVMKTAVGSQGEWGSVGTGDGLVGTEQVSQGDAAQSAAEFPKEIAATLGWESGALGSV